MMPGMPEKRTHDYARHGTTSLFAAMNVSDGTVIASTCRLHRAVEFKKFLTKIDAQVPEELDVHIVCDMVAIFLKKDSGIKSGTVQRPAQLGQGMELESQAIYLDEDRRRHPRITGTTTKTN